VIINRGNLVTLGIGFKAAFEGGITQAEATSQRVSTTVPSETGREEYGWLGKIPNVREWLGDRVVNNISQSGYTIKNKDYENTIGVPRNDILDDNLGIYGTLFAEMGMATVAHRELLTWGMLPGGFNNLCFDGQPFFSQAHPAIDANGNPTTYSNSDGAGGGHPNWFLIDDSRPLKPIIWQDRQPFDFVAKDRVDDENVFLRKEFIYGVDARHNVGYGFPQFAYGSTLDLTAANYAAARASMMGLKADYGRPIGVRPKLLAVGPTLESAGRALLEAQFNAAGASNIWYKSAELLVVDWLG